MRSLGRLPSFIYFVVAVALLPFVVHSLGSTYGLAAETLVTILVALSFNLLLGYTGQLSFGQAAYYGIGAYTAALFQLKLWTSSLAGILLAPLVSALAAAAVGALTIRKRGIYFALLTLAFAQVFYFIIFEWKGFTGGEFGLGGIVRLPVLGCSIRSDLALYTFVAALVVPAVFILWRIIDSPFGRILQAIRDNEQRAACLGYNTRLYKFLSFVISGAFTGLAGGLFSLIFCYISVDLLHWSTSGFAVMMTLIGGVQTFFGPAVGAFIFVLLKDLLSSFTEHWMIPFGILFVIFVLFAPQGIGGFARALTAARWQVDLQDPSPSAGTKSRPSNPTAKRNESLDPAAKSARAGMTSNIPQGTVVLSAEGLAKNFGALVAVNRVNIEARVGELHSIIGPNGAGKTTLFNLLTGILSPEEGSVTLQGRRVTRDSSYLRIRQGLARSFQIISIFKNLTVLENVRIAVQAVSGHRFDLLSRAGALVGVREKALDLLKEAGLAGREGVIAGTLSHGEQRLLEIAITLATRPAVLLLDEPFAGLPDSERGRIASMSKRLAMNYAVLLIEHDIDRVIEISDRITVMHEGQVIAAGSPVQIQENSRVQQAYLGRAGKTAAVPPSPSTVEAEPLLVLEKVNSFYGHSHILHDVSLTVGAKEMACLLGRNGAGKTTTLRSIMGVVRPRSGRILMGKVEIQSFPVHRVPPLGISIVPEGARVFPNLKVAEHLSMAVRHGRPGSWDIPRVFELMPQLKALNDRRGEHLSGGERKMLAIARALLANPRLLLLDEPLEGLAPAMVEVILELLTAMHGEMAILLVEQKASLILPLCESAFILNNGVVAYSGKSQELLANEVQLQQLLGV